MSRISIYRVEHTASGQGPFRAGGPLADALSEHTGQVTALAGEVQQDCPAFRPGQHLCAVTSLAQIELWFGPFRERLLAEGFGLFEYAPLPRNVLPGQSGTQVAFYPYAATPRRQLAW